MRTEQKAVLLAGGDRRSTELARLLAARPEFLVSALGLGEGLPRPEEGFQADILILPVPATSDGVYLKAPQAGERARVEPAASHAPARADTSSELPTLPREVLT